MPKEIFGETMYDMEEVARELGITTRTVITYRNKGYLRCSTIGGKDWYSEKELRNFLLNGGTRRQPVTVEGK